MKNFYTLLFTVILGVSISTAQAENSHAGINCRDAFKQGDLNQCAADRFKLADDELNRLYKKKLLSLKYDQDSFRDMQRAWIVFRDKACFYESGPREGGGSIWPLGHFNCMEYHTRKRIEDMKQYLECTSNGCPY